jgi:hypothetical protein
VARLGRGQPFAPIYLRGHSTVPAKLAPQIHVFLTTRRETTALVRDFGSKFIFLRGHSTVPLRLAPQITVVLQTRHRDRNVRREEVSVITLRNALVTAAAAVVPAPQSHIVLQSRRRDAAQARNFARIVVLHGPQPPLPAPQIHVIQQRRGGRLGRVIFLRGPAAPIIAPAPQIHIILFTRRKVSNARDIARILFLRGQLWGTIAGVTKDCTHGNVPLANCVVHLFRTSDDVKVATTVSDAGGNYSFSLIEDGNTYYAVAYKAGSPDLAGTTVNTLVAA